jgi:hypothetical protein
MEDSQEVFYDYYTGAKPDCPDGFTEAVWGYPVGTDQTFWVAADAREIQCYMPGTNQVYFDYIQDGEDYVCPKDLYVPAYTLYTRINSDNGIGSVSAQSGLKDWVNDSGGVCCNNGCVAFPKYEIENNMDACKGAVSKLDNCGVKGASTKLESMNLVSKVRAATESTGSVIYLPESGVYSSSLNGVDVHFLDSRSAIFYMKNETEFGIQSPRFICTAVKRRKLITDAATSVKWRRHRQLLIWS